MKPMMRWPVPGRIDGLQEQEWSVIANLHDLQGANLQESAKLVVWLILQLLAVVLWKGIGLRHH